MDESMRLWSNQIYAGDMDIDVFCLKKRENERIESSAKIDRLDIESIKHIHEPGHLDKSSKWLVQKFTAGNNWVKRTV